MSRPLIPILLAVAALAVACSKERSAAPADAPPAAVADWPDTRTLRVAEHGAEADRLALELRHEPRAATSAPALGLFLVGRDGAQRIWRAPVTAAVRDALWQASWALAVEEGGSRRIAVSNDRGASFRPVLKSPGGLVLCPHLQLAAKEGRPDWAAMPAPERWAAEVLETAVWSCDAAGLGCKSRSLIGATNHHSEPGADALAQVRHVELREALAIAEHARLDRGLALAIADAAVGYQHGLDAEELKRLGARAAFAVSDKGPLSADEQRTLQLRVTLASDEAKKTPPDQLSPRTSVAAMKEALVATPQAVGSAH